MNNNNNSNRNNNRRRGRGNRQQGGGNQNRIDSRARGNAPQMLDKYKKLAQDAAHNGDRVQAEYYLQFADHYFRVIADSRPRGDDQQQQRGRREEQDFSNDDDGDEDEFAAPRQSRDDRPREDRQDRERDERPREERQDRQRDDRPREDRQREDRPRGGRDRGDRQRQPRGDAEGESATETGGTDYEPADNPFVRPARNRTRGERTNRARSDETAEMTGNEGEIDASALPPSFSAASESVPEAEPERATRKLPPRRRRKPEGDAGEAGDNLTAVG